MRATQVCLKNNPRKQDVRIRKGLHACARVMRPSAKPNAMEDSPRTQENQEIIQSCETDGKRLLKSPPRLPTQ